MLTIREIARSVRHAPGLERMDLLWNAVREPYYRLTTRRGVVYRFGGHRVRFPASHARTAWDDYERESMRQFVRWIEEHPHGMVVDVGCSIGVFTHVALNVSRSVRVLAIDSDLASLRDATRLAGDDYPVGRFSVVHGLVADTGMPTAHDFIHYETRRRVHALPEWVTPRYANLGDDPTTPQYTLDWLLHRLRPGVELLLKIDVEGAELLALRGARQLLTRASTSVLLSVHGNLLPAFGHTAADVATFLDDAGYSHQELAVDHELHWWCEHQT